MTDEYAGRYGCYYDSHHYKSEQSDPLELVVIEVNSKSTLSVLPSPIVNSGGNVTLQCSLQRRRDSFVLDIEGKNLSWTPHSLQQSTGQFQALFPVGPITPSHKWTFRCYGYNSRTPHVWSKPSEPLDILVSGYLPDKPSLSAQPGLTVASGKNVTLLCQLESPVDIFFLSKEGAASPPLHLRAKYQAQLYQGEFSFSPVTSNHGGTYRCYGSNHTSYLLSNSSAPLELVVSESLGGPSSPPTGPISTAGLERYLEILIGFSVALVLLLFLLLFLFLRHRLQGKHKTSDTTLKGTQPENQAELDILSPHDEDPQGAMYAHVNLSRLRCGMTSPSFVQSGKFLDTKNRQTEEDWQRDSQVGLFLFMFTDFPPLQPHTALLTIPSLQTAVSEDPHEVTYAQLHTLNLRQRTAESYLSQEGDTPFEPSVYTTLAIH
ncbi:leukocyte immunoglobulin-like receptor subfamily B member 5 [Carlito syrichta]|uniref:Leukocyte immunoglobulin-like receptor subfamily B member 5 n=1 Tax=Carlito syrichta TaxID=1868482 RepID=A0A1U7TFF4_CARSF|nr:leukocyte immunoglobulin-like receptor subfamily B member 5 [Carlito syrichta]